MSSSLRLVMRVSQSSAKISPSDWITRDTHVKARDRSAASAQRGGNKCLRFRRQTCWSHFTSSADFVSIPTSPLLLFASGGRMSLNKAWCCMHPNRTRPMMDEQGYAHCIVLDASDYTSSQALRTHVRDVSMYPKDKGRRFWRRRCNFALV